MSRRTKGPKSKPDIFSTAGDAINRMERAVVYRMVDRNLFTADDILDWLVPAEQLRHLRAAYPYTQDAHGLPSFDVKFELQGVVIRMRFATTDMRCLPPNDVKIKDAGAFIQTVQGPAIMAALHEILNIVITYNVLRRIVKWFDQEHVSPSFARHYWPSMGVLLPPAHPFHDTDGTRFKDVDIPHQIRTDIRLAPEIVTKGLFCRPEDHADLDGQPVCMVYIGDGKVIPLFTK